MVKRGRIGDVGGGCGWLEHPRHWLGFHWLGLFLGVPNRPEEASGAPRGGVRWQAGAVPRGGALPRGWGGGTLPLQTNSSSAISGWLTSTAQRKMSDHSGRSLAWLPSPPLFRLGVGLRLGLGPELGLGF